MHWRSQGSGSVALPIRVGFSRVMCAKPMRMFSCVHGGGGEATVIVNRIYVIYIAFA